MGAAQSSMRPAGMVLPVSYLGELGSEIQYEKSMGSSRFLKSIKARHRSGALVIKVFVKLDSHMDLRPTSKRIAAERAALADCPNLLPYSQALATERAGYLIRQWLASNLYDRISTRPFLTMIEKKWIAFQLLSALRDAHIRKVSHGDIKSENVLVTSWNWVYLTDFSSAFKPTYIPEDDPSDFSYFFDTSGRRTCYLAPERFYSQDSEIGRKKATLEVGRSLGKVTESMDVFSLGCVLAELFMEGAPPFTLAQLLQYRSGDYSLSGYLAQIEDDDIRSLIQSMVSLDPADRRTCEYYYTEEYDRSFPASFYDFFHDFVASTNEINAVHPAQSSFSTAVSASGTTTPQIGANANTATLPSAPETDSEIPLPSNADEIINRIWTDFESIERRIDPQRTRQSTLEEQPHRLVTSADSVFPVLLPLSLADTLAPADTKAPTADGPAIILLSLICSNLRNCAHASSITRGLDTLLAISKYLTDETKLDRLLPFVVSLLQNDVALVRGAALRTLTQTLIAIGTITPSNAAIFPQFILPNVVPFATDPDEAIRCLLAQSLPYLAESGQWYLDMTQAMKAEGTFKLTRAHDFDGAPYEMSYDASLLDLQSQIQDLMNILLVDLSSAVRRALVLNVTPLCAFLGRARTADILGLMTTHLNDRDWRLRAEFFGSMVGVSTCISVKSVDEYVLPLLAGALADTEEQVTSRELSSLATLTSLGIHQKKRLWEALFAVMPLLYHPNVWLRSGASSFVAAASKQLSETERWCSLYPGLRKILSNDIGTIDELNIMSALPAPIPRPVYEAAIAWSIRASGSPMWKGHATIHGMQLMKAIEAAMEPPVLHSDDKSEMQRLQTLGMSEADSYKLLIMRGYIKQIAVMRKNTSSLSAEETNVEEMSFAEEVRLADFGIVPQNIIFSTTDNLGARFQSRAVSSDGILRSPSARNTASVASFDYNTRTGTRSVSGSSTADALRRRLAMNNVSSTSLNSIPGDYSPKQPNSASVQSTSTTSTPGSDRVYPKDDSFDNQSNAPTVVSSSNPAGPSPLSRQRSRVNMHGVELAKASAAVGENSSNATGHLTTEVANGAAIMSGVSVSSARVGHQPTSGRFHSTYEGDDPAIKQLLDRAYLESYREPMPEFGPFIPDKVNRKRIPRPGARERIHRRPEGFLIGNLAEHTDAITSFAVAPDHLFFASGSADGTIKIWDTTRLEKNVTSRSRQTIHQGGRITAVVTLENSHCIVSASTNGSIWVNRVDVQQNLGQMPRYGKVATIRQHLIDSTTGDYATCMLHYDTDSASKLVYATMQSKIVVLDVRTLRSITTYQLPNHIGPISCMCIDKMHTWLVTGTLAGYLSLWDLRFGLLLRTWKAGHSGTGGVRSCTIHNTRGKGRWVIVTLDNYEGFETWDIGTAQCVERYMLVHDTASKEALRNLRRRRRTSSTMSAQGRQAVAGAHAFDESPAQAIENFLASSGMPMERKHDGHPNTQDGDPAAALHGFEYRPNKPAITTLLHGVDYSNALSGSSSLGSLPTVVELESGNAAVRARPSAGWIISAGEDRRLVFWDLENAEKSSLIVGAEEGEDKTTFGYEVFEGTHIYTETRSSGKAAASSSKRGNLTAGSQQDLLRAHQDAITALTVLDLPFRCVVSGDRSGNVKVWE